MFKTTVIRGPTMIGISAMRYFITVLALSVPLAAAAAQPKVGLNDKVESEVIQGVKYVAPNDNGRRAHVEAWDVKTGKMLWDATILNNVINPMLEEKVQWVFIKKLTPGQYEHELIVETTDDRTYSLDLNTKGVFRIRRSADSTVVIIFVVCVTVVGLLIWFVKRRRALNKQPAP
jgi:hypothetical protein